MLFTCLGFAQQAAAYEWTQAEASACGWGGFSSPVQNELISIFDGSGMDRITLLRSRSGFSTQLSGKEAEAQLEQRLEKLLQFQIRDYVGNCKINRVGALDLLPTQQNFAQYQRCPNSLVGAGCTNNQNLQLHQTVLFQEDVVYSIGPWMEGYAPAVGALMNQQIFGSGGLWDKVSSTADLCQDDMDRYVIGQLPGWDGGSRWIDPDYLKRCGLFYSPKRVPLGVGERYTRSNPPYTSSLENGAIYGSNSDEIDCASGCQLSQPKIIESNDAHDALKYGCLRQAIKGDIPGALKFFNIALSNWDGTGFPSLGSNSDLYFTHDLGLVLMCANALGDMAKTNPLWTSKLQQRIENQMWELQDVGENGTGGTGGLWNTYCSFGTTANCDPNPYPYPQGHLNTGIAHNATMLNEDAALVLSAYGLNVWQSARKAKSVVGD